MPGWLWAGSQGYMKSGKRLWTTLTILKLLSKSLLIAMRFTLSTSFGVLNLITSMSTITITCYFLMISRISQSTTSQPSPLKNGTLFWETHIGRNSGPSPMQVILQLSILTHSGSPGVLSFQCSAECWCHCRVSWPKKSIGKPLQCPTEHSRWCCHSSGSFILSQFILCVQGDQGNGMPPVPGQFQEAMEISTAYSQPDCGDVGPVRGLC